MNFDFILGCDVSKEWLDFNLTRTADHQSLAAFRIENDSDAIREMASELTQNYCSQGFTLDSCVLLLEHTGIYQRDLVDTWIKLGAKLSIVDARKISHYLPASQMAHKTDELDAARIAQFGSRFSDQIDLWQAPPKIIELLKTIQSLQERLITANNMLKHPVGEMACFTAAKDIMEQVDDIQQEVLCALEKAIIKTEKRIERLISQDDEIQRLYELVSSVTGVGPVTATAVIVNTEAFTRFTPIQARQFANFEGIVPPRFESGKSVRRKKKSPSRKGRSLKTLLTMGAKSAIRYDPEIKKYANRKLEEGKHYFVVINNVRNKIIDRVFAVVRKNSTYLKNANACLENS